MHVNPEGVGDRTRRDQERDEPNMKFHRADGGKRQQAPKLRCGYNGSGGRNIMSLGEILILF
jgi:hypothetical protein